MKGNNSQSSGFIVLITDFGPRGSHYVASMKAVIYKINPLVSIIDLSHSVKHFSIIEASYLLKSTYKYFPSGTVFVCVVDPGVGSKRKIVVLWTKDNYYFVGPDNGIFPRALENNISESYVIENENYFQKPISKTFHGRDIMAPIGAFITKDIPLSNFGPSINKEELIKVPLMNKIDKNKNLFICTIQYIDDFGNLTTTIKIDNHNKIQQNKVHIILNKNQKISLKKNNTEYEGVYVSHFAKVPKDALLFMKGSTGYLEISLNQGNAAQYLNVVSGEKLELKIL
jgi:hypothetical protein